LFNLNVPSDGHENGWKFFCEDMDTIPILRKDFNWCECPKCGKVDIAECGEPSLCGCFSIDEIFEIYGSEEEHGINVSPTFMKTPRLVAAFKRAKNHIFSDNRSKKVPQLLTQINIFKSGC
jgi:hypothetical protein